VVPERERKFMKEDIVKRELKSEAEEKERRTKQVRSHMLL
jgi:hypothetical protein